MVPSVLPRLARLAPALALAVAILLLGLGSASPTATAAQARCRDGFELLPGAVECTPIAPREPPMREEPAREPPPEPVVEIPPVAGDPGGDDPVVISDPEDSIGISDPEDSVAIPPSGGDSILTEPPVSLAIDPIEPQDPANELGSVSLHKRGCPADFDAAAASEVTLVSVCLDPMQGTTFTLDHGGGTSASLPTAGDYSGSSFVEWQDVFPGPFTLAEDLPPGYGPPIIICTTWTGDAEGPDVAMSVSAGAIVADLPPGEHVHCSWFNVPLPAASASVEKWLCPSEIDATSTDQADYFAACDTPMDDVVFYLLGEGQDPTAAAVAATAGGVAVFGGIQHETVTITEQLPAGFDAPIVFCATHPAPPAPPPDGLILQTVTDGQITVETGPGHNVACSWFNIPHGDDGTGLTVEKWLCPADVDASNDEVDVYQAICAEPLDDIDFNLQGDGYGLSGATVDGTVGWPGLVPGPFELTEEKPAGFGEPIVFCGFMTSTTTPSGDQAATIEFARVEVTGGDTISFQLDAEPALYCEWFNVPLPDDGGDPDDGDDPGDGGDPDGGDDPTDDGDPDGGDDPDGSDDPTPGPDEPATPVVVALPDTGSGAAATPAAPAPGPALGLMLLTAGLLCGLARPAVTRRRHPDRERRG